MSFRTAEANRRATLEEIGQHMLFVSSRPFTGHAGIVSASENIEFFNVRVRLRVDLAARVVTPYL